jgi:hypothetical protein
MKNSTDENQYDSSDFTVTQKLREYILSSKVTSKAY